MDDTLTQSKQIAEELLARLGVKADISQEEIAGEPALQIDTSDQALIIGRGGENLRALQYIVHQIVKRDQPDAPMITVDVAGYRRARLHQLDVMVNLAKTQALNEDEPVKLIPMNAYERRYVHSMLADTPEFTTESIGEEPDRRIVIRKTS